MRIPFAFLFVALAVTPLSAKTADIRSAEDLKKADRASTGVTISYKDFSDADAKTLLEFTSAVSIGFDQPCKVTGAGLESLSSLASLKRFTFTASDANGDEDLAALGKLTQLTSLKVTPRPAAKGSWTNSLATIENLANLRVLCYQRYSEPMLAGISKLIHLKTLEWIVVGDFAKAEDWDAITALVELEKLFIGHAVPAEALPGIGKLGALTELRFENDKTGLDNAGMQKLAGLSALRKLVMNAARMTNKGMSSFAELKALEELYITHANLISDAGLAELTKCKQLKALVLMDTPDITSEGADAFTQKMRQCSTTFDPTLEEEARDGFYFDPLPRDNNRLVVTSGDQLKYVTKVTDEVWIDCTATADDLKKLSSFSAIRKIRVAKTDNEGLKAIGTIKSLNILQCDDLTGIDDDGFSALGNLTELQLLVAPVCPGVTGKGYEQLAGCKSLRSLEFWLPEDQQANRCEITDKALGKLKKLKTLRRLILNGAYNVTDDGLSALEKCTDLRHLALNGASKITGRTLPDLAGMTKLKILGLAGTGLTDENLKHLADLPVRELLVSNCAGVSDTGIAHLEGCEQIKHLDLRYCSKVTDACVPSLLKMTRLVKVGIAGTGITPEGGMELMKRDGMNVYTR